MGASPNRETLLAEKDCRRSKLTSNKGQKPNKKMAIANAIKKGSSVYIYDEKGRQLGIVPAGGGELHGFTSGSVSIRRGSSIYIYDEKGRQTGTTPAR